jgi:hypothetical protein
MNIEWWIDTAALVGGASAIAWQYGTWTGVGVGLIAYFMRIPRTEP